MVCIQDSKSHRADSHSYTHHWQWSISCSEWLPELSTSLVSSHHGRHSMSHQQDHVTFQSQQPNKFQLVVKGGCYHAIPCKCCPLRQEYSWQPGLCGQILSQRDTASQDHMLGETEQCLWQISQWKFTWTECKKTPCSVSPIGG